MVWEGRSREAPPYPHELFLCAQASYVVSNRQMPRIRPFLDLERHIIRRSRTRSARARPGRVTPATTNRVAGVERQNPACSWAHPGLDDQAGGYSVEGGGERGRLPSDFGTQ